MFEAKLDNIDILRDSIGTISEMIDEAEMSVTDTGIRITAADRAVVVVVDFFLSRNAFNEFALEGDKKIGVNLLNLLQVLRRAMPGDILSIKLIDNKLELILSGGSTRKFVLPLIDISREDAPPLDKFDFSANLRVSTDMLNNGFDDADLITDSIVFTIRKDQLMLKAESDSSSTQLELQPGTEWLKIIDMAEPVRARYSLDYLKKIIKARKLAPEATLAMSTDYPLKLEFETPGKLRLSFILAPRVEE
jgi:proliferating cell nuclear antigen